MVDRNTIKRAHRMIPGLKDVTATIYRRSISDEVLNTKVVRYVRYKDDTKVESKGDLGPMRVEMATVHLYELELGEWRVEENDILHVESPRHRIDKWLRVESCVNDHMGTRFVCTCVPDGPVEAE